MTRLSVTLPAVLAVLLLPTLSTADDPADEEIIIAHPRVGWPDYPAFYVDATGSILAAMQTAIRQFVADDPDFCNEEDETLWVCQGEEFRFFSAVSGGGEYLYGGYACQVIEDFPRQKYYPARLLNQSFCVVLDWDVEEGRYFVESALDY